MKDLKNNLKLLKISKKKFCSEYSIHSIDKQNLDEVFEFYNSVNLNDTYMTSKENYNYLKNIFQNDLLNKYKNIKVIYDFLNNNNFVAHLSLYLIIKYSQISY